MQVPSICHGFAIKGLVHQPESVFSKAVLEGFLFLALKSMYFIAHLFQRTSSEYRADRRMPLPKIDVRPQKVRLIGTYYSLHFAYYIFLSFQHVLQSHKHDLFVARRLRV